MVKSIPSSILSVREFEWHPENKGKESQVLLGRLGADLAAPRANEAPFKPVPACGSCNDYYFKETSHYIAPELQDYWSRNGGIPVFGYPLSEAFQGRVRQTERFTWSSTLSATA